MVSLRGQKKLAPRPDRSSFRGLIQNFRRASPPLSYGESPRYILSFKFSFCFIKSCFVHVLFSCLDPLFLLVHEFMLKFANLLIAILGMLLAWHCQM